MSELTPDGNKPRVFSLTAIALKNQSTIFLLSLILAVFGILSYRSLPKELFPEVMIPTVMVKTIYPGNPPVDMENLITQPLENEINTVSGIKSITSTSAQDNSDIIVEFETGMEIRSALQDVKDAVERVKPDLPSDLPADPMVTDIDFSEFPIININLSGDFTIDELKRHADFLKDETEQLKEISTVEITGLPEREIQININPIQLNAAEIGFGDIENAIRQENLSVAGGTVLFGDNTRWAVRTAGEFKDVRQIKDIIVKHEGGNILHIGDVGEVEDTYADPVSFSRLDEQPVASLQVIKKAGENLLAGTEGIFRIIDKARDNGNLPPELNITITNDQSEQIRTQTSSLENSVILAVFLVIMVLFLFLGLKNALFVGLAIPLSMLSSFMIFGLLGIQINMIVLFSLILALGLLVDNAIVAVDNINRFVDRGFNVFEAAKRGIGEIAAPIITSTATTLSAFLPLAFWSGIVGEFMKYMPLTLIIVLSSSLFVALVIIPVFSDKFFRNGRSANGKNVEAFKKTWGVKLRPPFIAGTGLLAGGIILHFLSYTLYGNIFILAAIIILGGYYVLLPMQKWFQHRLLPAAENFYCRIIVFALRGKNPLFFIAGTVIFLVLSIGVYTVRSPNVLFFPDNEPRFINIFAEMPVGTDIHETNRKMVEIEKDVNEIISPYRHIVESVLTNIGRGAIGEMEFAGADNPNRGLITVTFVDFEKRHGINTNDIMGELSNELVGNYPGVKFNIEKNQTGPPTGPPISIEISGSEFERLLAVTDDIQGKIENSGIQGIEGLTKDLETDKPEITINIDRDIARRFGISTFSVANTIRTSLFGNEVSTFKLGEEEFPVMLRLQKDYRNNMETLMNQRITFRSQSTGRLMQVPVSAVAEAEYGKTYGSINRKDLKRVITLTSNILPGFNATRVNQQISELLGNYEMLEGYAFTFTGEQQEQEESMAFLIIALLVSVALISVILVTQFNSFIKPLIIIGSVVFSTAGVFFGLALFNMDFVIIMTGVGIISLAGVVVNNAIVLVDYTDYLHENKKKQMGSEANEQIDPRVSLSLIRQAGRTRFRPVVLTAITTVLGLIPLAIGFNINFVTLMTELSPRIYFGGENAAFWSPMACTVIFGLTVATFLTLVIVPCMYRIIRLISYKTYKWKNK